VHPRTHRQARPRSSRLKVTTVVAAIAALAALQVAPAQAGDGGTGTGGGTSGTSGTPGKAKLVHGKAIPPSNAPNRVVGVIEAANRIAKGTDYCYGGGHSSFKSSCYDCSGSVSYALHGGRLVKSPMDSSGFMRWARHGRGKWITVYANGGHAFMTVAGLRFDTSDTRGKGPGWARSMGAENPREYRKRHKGRF
jgi:hypothetical protein